MAAKQENALQRAPSNLELLSFTAAWKNDIENPARVSPTEHNRVSPCLCRESVPYVMSMANLPTVMGSPTLGSSSSWSESWLAESSPNGPGCLLIADGSVPGTAKSTNGTPPLLPSGSIEANGGSRHEAPLLPTYSDLSNTATISTLHAAFSPPHLSPKNQDSSRPVSSSSSAFHQPSTGLRQSPTTVDAPEPIGKKRSVEAVGQALTSTLIVPAAISHGEVAALSRDNAALRQELHAKDKMIATLNTKIKTLSDQVEELKQLPTGKVSQIPVHVMLEIMQEYGSEISDVATIPRKDSIQKASIVRQFRRWNPNFFEFFIHRGGKWVPKLGKAGELERRVKVRNQAKKGKKPGQAAK